MYRYQCWRAMLDSECIYSVVWGKILYVWCIAVIYCASKPIYNVVGLISIKEFLGK